MSVPMSIQHQLHRGLDSPLLPHTPAVATAVYGSSPGSGRADKHQSSGAQSQARKLYKRIQWDEALDEKEWTVGVLKTREQAERKSGAEAWSLRVQSTVVEYSFPDFVAKYDKEGEEVPFHRIAWFKQSGVIVWEAEHLRHKIGGEGHQPHGHPSSSSGGGQAVLSVSPALGGSSMLGCSPPTGSFMARLAAATGGPLLATSAGPGLVSTGSSSFTGLPPRCSNSPLEGAAGAGGGSAAQHGTPHQQYGWRPHRLSGTDIGSGGSSGWCVGSAPHRETPSPWPGPVPAHVGFANNGHAGCAPGSVGSHSTHTLSGHVTPSPLLGSSPGSSSNPGSCAGPSVATLLGSSPHVVSGSWGAVGDGAHPSCASSSAGGVLGPNGACVGRVLGGPECSSSALNYSSASPGGSCSSSWAGTSPLAAALVAGASSLPQPRAVSGGGSGWPLGGSLLAGGLAAAMAAVGAGGAVAGLPVEQQLQQQQLLVEPAELADYSQLPEKCWMDVLQRLGTRELCCAARVNTSLKALAARACVWDGAYQRLFGMPPPSEYSVTTVKRLCRRSELKASRWLDADVEARTVGFTGTWCCQLDESKVVSGDGCAVRLWAHESGRRIATLRGHAGRVTSVAFDDERILSGCSQGTVKLWSMDELKLAKTFRHHTGPISGTLLLRGMPVSSGKDGLVCLWEAATPNIPIVVLAAGGPVHAMQLHEERDYLLTGSNTLGVWDVNTTQLLFTLDAPPPPAATPAGSPGLSNSSGSSSASLAAAAAGAAAAAAVGAAAAAAAADLEDDDEDLLQNGWLLQDDEDDSDSDLSEEDDQEPGGGGGAEQQQPSAAAAAGQGGGGGRAGRAASARAPWTSISCQGNILAAGNAAGVVLWDIRTQEAVGSIPSGGSSRSAAGSNRGGSSSSGGLSCVGVQLDDWRLVTGFAAHGGSSSGGGGGTSGCGANSSSSNAAWWHSGIEGYDQEGFLGSGHSLQVYDIRAAASFSTAAAGGGKGAGGGAAVAADRGSSRGLWTAAPVMSLPVPNRITCFQFHGQHLLVGQEGSDCCLLGFHPPGSCSGHAAAAWGYGGGPGSSSSRGAAAGCGYSAGMMAAAGASPGGVYMASPGAGAGGAGFGEEAGGGGGSGRKGKKGGTKVPAKKQTRYPKRTTR